MPAFRRSATILPFSSRFPVSKEAEDAAGEIGRDSPAEGKPEGAAAGIPEEMPRGGVVGANLAYFFIRLIYALHEASRGAEGGEMSGMVDPSD